MATEVRRLDQAIGAAFYALLLVAGIVVFRLGDNQWFFLDEWSVIANRPMPSLDSLLGAHNGHWITTNVVAYKINFWLFGLHTYAPYLLATLVLHLAIAAMLRRTMRRYGVRNWLASALALVFALFGAGHENMVFGFQVALNSSVLLGLIYLELVDTRTSEWSRRDWLALGVGLVSLTTSGTVIPIIAGVFLVMLAGRGWRLAVSHAAPLAAVYIAWYLTFGESTPEESRADSITSVFG